MFRLGIALRRSVGSHPATTTTAATALLQPRAFLRIGRAVLEKKKRKKKTKVKGHLLRGQNYDERLASENASQEELFGDVMDRKDMFKSPNKVTTKQVNIGGQKTNITFEDIGHWKDYTDNHQMAALAFEKMKKLPTEAQAAILASMETEKEPMMEALNEICSMDPRELSQMDPGDMEVLFKKADIDPRLMFGPESMVKEECDKLAEMLAIEFMELRNYLPAASRFKFGEKGLLAQVHQIEKFLINNYVGSGAEADLIIEKIKEIEKLPRSVWSAEIQRRKQLVDQRNKESETKLVIEKAKRRRLLAPKPRLEFISPELNLPKRKRDASAIFEDL